MTDNRELNRWIKEVTELCQPDGVVWCDGSEEERRRLMDQAVKSSVFMPLNQEKLPGCYLHRSHPLDVARTEHQTFICCEAKEEAGPNNNWMPPAAAREKVRPLFQGAMRGRTMYVLPFLMGTPGSPFTKVGVQTTDSLYVALSMRIMTRLGQAALKHLGASGTFTRCMHALRDLSPERRYILHFPEENEIWSIGSGYGGNALLGKKCLSLRIASTLARREGWLAEHMLIVGIQPPKGPIRYLAGAFPSACGKTNLAMLVPPPAYAAKGWKVFTVGDDIAWMRVGRDGRLWAVNPENGFFGVAPGTSRKSNPNALETVSRNSLYTNVALRPDGTVWWEGLEEAPPALGMLDWQGRPWTPQSKEKAAHPNSRFTAPAAQCPTISPEWENPEGVPISALLFGARRSRVMPLVFEARDWQHGTFLAATLESETTAAATGQVGVVRRDPMAMLPFCGYNMADYFAHWLAVGKKLKHPPQIFRVNWFRKSADDRFLWPGYGENLRVLEWILGRCEGTAAAQETPIGYLPTLSSLNREGLDLSDEALGELLQIDRKEWRAVSSQQAEYFSQFGERLPAGMREELAGLARRL